MSASMTWTIVVIIGVGTFLFRLSGIQLLGNASLPEPLMRALRYVPAAVIAAIVVPAIVHGGPDGGLHLHNPRLLAGLVAAVVAWTTRSVLLTLAIGMGALWLMQWMLP